jgi:hypothetical protein
MTTKASKHKQSARRVEEGSSTPVMTFKETMGSMRLGRPALTFKQMRDIAIEDLVESIIDKMRSH